VDRGCALRIGITNAWPSLRRTGYRRWMTGVAAVVSRGCGSRIHVRRTGARIGVGRDVGRTSDRRGPSLSGTITVWSHDELLPELSVAVQWIVTVPTGNGIVNGLVIATLGTGRHGTVQLSVASRDFPETRSHYSARVLGMRCFSRTSDRWRCRVSDCECGRRS